MGKDSRELMMKLRQNLYYVLIAASSFLALVFLPMLGSDISGGWDFPETKKAWTVYIAMRAIITFLNVFIYASFINQGKLNVVNTEEYKRGMALLRKVNKKAGYNPRSPLRFNANEYGWKGFWVLLGTAASLVALEQAILKFDPKTLLVYGTTVAMAIFFGIFEMKKVEIYWTVEFVEYAEQQAEKLGIKEEEDGR